MSDVGLPDVVTGLAASVAPLPGGVSCDGSSVIMSLCGFMPTVLR